MKELTWFGISKNLIRNLNILSLKSITYKLFDSILVCMSVDKIQISSIVFETTESNTYEQVHIEKHNTTTYPYSAMDENFSHSPDSISIGMVNDNSIEWVPAETLVIKNSKSQLNDSEKNLPNYTLDIDNLEQPYFCNRSLTYGLLALNWFAPKPFEQLFKERKIKGRYLYEFKVYICGKICRICVDSFIPIKEGKPIFAEPIRNSIFPCLYEKIFAKIYECYEGITESMVEIIQTLTFYHKERIPFYIFTQQSEKLVALLVKNFEEQGLCFFRTRNSVRLETVGFSSSYEYIITRVVKISGVWLAQFLEIDGTSWIGKYSKLRAFWQLNHPQVEAMEINTSGYGRQNYIQIDDLIGVSREFIILHNNSKSHKSTMCVESKLKKHIFKITAGQEQCENMIEINFKRKICWSLVLLITYINQEPVIEKSSFKKEKSQNFIQFIQKPSQQYYLIAYSEDKSGSPVPFNMYLSGFPRQLKVEELSNISTISKDEQVAFQKKILKEKAIDTYLQSHKYPAQNFIRVKSYHRQLGIGVVLINLKEGFREVIKVEIDHEILAAENANILNLDNKQVILKAPCSQVIVFKLKTNFNGETVFPPKNGIKFLRSESNNHFRSVFI